MKNWFGEASEFLLGSSEYKPFLGQSFEIFLSKLRILVAGMILFPVRL
jgi:hypothetical protein